jgi:hypothetical protein
MLKKVIISVVALACLLAAASYFSPHWTLYRMRSAIEERDYPAFSKHVDLPALRGSFKSQITAALHEQVSGKNEDDSLSAIGQGIVASLAGPMLDVLITPAGVIEMMNAGTPKITQAVITSAITQVPNAAESVPDMELEYRGWHNVAFRRADLPENADRFILRRNGWWSWKLAAVEFAP